MEEEKELEFLKKIQNYLKERKDQNITVENAMDLFAALLEKINIIPLSDMSKAAIRERGMLLKTLAFSFTASLAFCISGRDLESQTKFDEIMDSFPGEAAIVSDKDLEEDFKGRKMA